MQKNKYVFEKELGNNIFSFNFSKEAFYNKIWDNMTTQARGLFIDIKNYKILARSYNKFFNINERKETRLDALEENLVFPVKFYLKYNGFLGILSVKDEQLFFASKSTNVGAYVEYFKTIFYKKFDNKQIEALKDKIINDNVTIVFEVIDPINDPHIIEYNEPQIVLLDMIYNTTDYNKVSYDQLIEFTRKYKIKAKELVYTANDIEEFKNIYEAISLENYQLKDNYIEGFVIEDNNNFMVKIKTSYYYKWKYLRSKMEYALKNNDFNIKSKDKLEISFMKYLQEKYENKNIDIESINIINERNEFEKVYVSESE